MNTVSQPSYAFKSAACASGSKWPVNPMKRHFPAFLAASSASIAPPGPMTLTWTPVLPNVVVGMSAALTGQSLLLRGHSNELPDHLVGEPSDDAVRVRVREHQDEVRRAGLDERLELRDRRGQVVV